MNFRALIRSPETISGAIREVGDSWVAGDKISIYFPQFYTEKKLAEITDKVYSVGIVMIVVNNSYSVLRVNTSITFTPTELTTVKIEDESYYEMVFDKGDVIIPNIHCVKKDSLPYLIYDAFFSKGQVPIYLDYDDICSIFDSAAKYADAHIADRPEVMHVMASIIARDRRDRTKFFRQSCQDKVKDNDKVVFIPIRSIEYGATNTTTKLGGAYFSTGVISALNSPATEEENIESILRE